jgi:uncharacterized repeat protein (TIGR02543 family)
MNEETIEKLIQSRGNTHIIEIVQKEKERFQELDEIIKNKVCKKEPYPFLFTNLIDMIERIYKHIENIKKEERFKKQIEEEEERVKKQKEQSIKDNIVDNQSKVEVLANLIEQKKFQDAKELFIHINFNFLTSEEVKKAELYNFLAYLESSSFQEIINQFNQKNKNEKTLIIDRFYNEKYKNIITDDNNLFYDEIKTLINIFNEYHFKIVKNKKTRKKLFLVFSILITFSSTVFFLFIKKNIVPDYNFNSYTITYTIYDVDYDPLKYIVLDLGETITQVSLSRSHSSAITSNGRLYTWGRNSSGQLGDGTRTTRNIPTEITERFNLKTGEKITQVSLGENYSSALTSNGRIFTWGRNSNGQLGDGTISQRTTPTEITASFNLSVGETITQISLGAFHSSALTSNGRLFTWGLNSNGQLGDGTMPSRTTPTEITVRFNLRAGEIITQVSLGSFHSSAITSNGLLFTWGLNSSGQLGDNSTTNRNVPTIITARFSLGSGETITQLSLGSFHSSAITSNGRLFTWGRNSNGQLGDGTTTDRTTPTEITERFNLSVGETITQLSLGSFHLSAITSNGRLFTLGLNSSGQLGDLTTTMKSIPTEITTLFNLKAGERITQVSLGFDNSSAITSNGRLFIWGLNGSGELGDGTTTNKYLPTLLDIKSVYYSESIDYIFNETIMEKIPIREGYTFEGWYTNRTLITAYKFKTMPAEDLMLYGRWIKE